MDSVVLTVADADSEFSAGYFEVLGTMFASASKVQRYETIWQSPVMHMKNYHRQPGPVSMGMMFTCMTELAVMSDPNAIRFPYSTYSLALNLARRVGGWDPDWIAEDYHMGIKCYLLTLGEVHVEPLLLPTVNYTPEELGSWTGSIYARWVQAKRHSLGFSDLAYFFMMIPLIFAHSAAKANRDRHIHSLRRFWIMGVYGVCLIIKLVNIHVVIGVLTTYTALQAVLRFLMLVMMDQHLHINFLFERTGYCPTLLFSCCSLLTLCMSSLWLLLYGSLKSRLEGKEIRSSFQHWVMSVLCFAVYSPLYMFGIGFCSWAAAWNVLTKRAFDYEVAPKPTPGAACVKEGSEDKILPEDSTTPSK